MSCWIKPFAGIACCAVFVGILVVSRQGPTNTSTTPDGPVARWSFDQISGPEVTDSVGGLTGKLLGAPKPVSQALELHGGEDGILIWDRKPPRPDLLPKEALSIVALLRLDRPAQHGGIVTLIGGRQQFRKGFSLGYDHTHFNFGLSAEGADDGYEKFTTVKARTRFERGKWYHLAATYDGQTMCLYVNGRMEGSSREQFGHILYRKAAPFILGRYQDDEYDTPFSGALKEISLYHRALTADEVAAQFAAHRELVATSPVDAGPFFVIEPYLQYPTRDSISILWETSTPGTSVVEYGTINPPIEKATTQVLTTLHEVHLKGLKPSTKYFYQVTTTDSSGRQVRSPILTFLTAVNPDEAFSFTVIGDTQRNPKITGKIAQLMWDRRPHFVIHTGDVVDEGPDKREWVEDLFRSCAELFGRVPLFPTIGNHEKNHEHYYKYFSLPSPEYFYRYQYGNADFFVIDSNKKLHPGSEQYVWLNKELARSDAKWKFVYHHHPAWSSDDNDYGDSWKEASTLGDLNPRWLVPLYEKYNVDIVFNGHIHLYERTWPIRGGKVDSHRGVIYITSGGGGGKLENFAPTPTWFKAECRVDHHFCYVTIHDGLLSFKAFDQQGRLFDSFELRK